uniref:Uncharacterized protein n=1 Tax=Oryza punctata TaxID=4537 RepID=A0A0E0KN68_ORYPU
MSTVVAAMAVVVLLLLTTLAPQPELTMAAHAAAVAGEGRQLPRPPALLVPFRARSSHRRQPAAFHGRAANGCMPRGFRVPPSAPSRYANYHTLDAGLCDDHGGGGGGGGRRKP